MLRGRAPRPHRNRLPAGLGDDAEQPGDRLQQSAGRGPGRESRRAIQCYEAALRVSTETAFPHDWAMTQNNLGNAYGDLPGGDRDDNLRRAIECGEAALRVYAEAAFPQ